MGRSPLTFGYVRISTREEKQKNSIQVQSVSIRERWARQQQSDSPFPEFHGFFKDECSGRKRQSSSMKDRPHGRELLGSLREGDVVLVYSLDRISRIAWDIFDFLIYCRERKVRVVVLDCRTPRTSDLIAENEIDFEDPVATMFLAGLGMAAELEGRAIGRRTADSLRHVGQTINLGMKPPPGWIWEGTKDNKKLVRHEGEQEAIEALWGQKNSLARGQGVSRQKLVDWLNSEGYRRADNSKWTDRVVRGIIERGEGYDPTKVKPDIHGENQDK